MARRKLPLDEIAERRRGVEGEREELRGQQHTEAVLTSGPRNFWRNVALAKVTGVFLLLLLKCCD
jgi:hypothetical protein